MNFIEKIGFFISSEDVGRGCKRCNWTTSIYRAVINIFSVHLWSNLYEFFIIYLSYSRTLKARTVYEFEIICPPTTKSWLRHCLPSKIVQFLLEIVRFYIKLELLCQHLPHAQKILVLNNTMWPTFSNLALYFYHFFSEFFRKNCLQSLEAFKKYNRM